MSIVISTCIAWHIVPILLRVIHHARRRWPSLRIIITIWAGCHHAAHTHHARLVRLTGGWIGWIRVDRWSKL